MDWKQRIEIIHRILKKKLLDQGKKDSLTNIANLLGIPLHKYQSWRKGQMPIADDIGMLVRDHDFNADWLLLGIGEPTQAPLDGPLDPENVDICDALHDLVAQLPDKLPKIAEIGGIKPGDLYNMIHTQTLPQTKTIAKWVLHYRINANFLLAQIGQPFLTEEQFNETGKLEYVRWKRGDFIELDKSGDDAGIYQAEIDRLEKELQAARKSLEDVSANLADTNQERRSLQERLNNQEAENRELQENLATLENENLALKTIVDAFKKQNQAKAAGQE